MEKITVQRVARIIHSWPVTCVLMMWAMYFWDSSFPGYGATGWNHYTAVANLVMSAVTMVLYILVTQMVLEWFGLNRKKATPLGVDNSDLNELLRQATKKAEERV